MAEGQRQDRRRGPGRARAGRLTDAAALEPYLAELTARLMRALDDCLLAVWIAGSAAAGQYEHGRSDVDVIAVASGPLDPAARRRVVSRVRHDVLPCPARKLELVVHRAPPLTRGRPAVELNLETGAAGTATPDVPEFWFVVDLSVVRERGVALEGPPAAAVVAEPPREDLLAALAASLDWHRRDAPLDDAVLNACRVLLRFEEARWSGKREAGEWAAAQGHAPRGLVEAALALRAQRPGAAPRPAAAAGFLEGVYRRVTACSASSRSGRLNS